MVNEKPKKVEKKSVSKKKSTVKKKATTVQKEKSPVKKPIAKKATKKPAVKSKPKVSNVKKAAATKVIKPAAKKPVKKSLKNVIADVNIDLKTEKGSKTQNEKIVNVIDKLSLPQEQHYVTTVPGVFRKVPAVQKVPVPVHKEVPIAGILNYFKGIF
ncbi:MAG: hypothetical protein ACUZ9M_08420 [Candidatus Scalindua sp.]